MKVISILYNIIFSILFGIGLPASVTGTLTSVSLIAIGAGLVIVAPQLAILIAILLIVGQFWRG